MPQSQFELPGLNLPLNWVGGGDKSIAKAVFPTALDAVDLDDGACTLPLTTLREFTMLHIMNSLTDKPGWEVKVFDSLIVEKWKAEAMATEGADVTEKMMDWVIAELRYKAGVFGKRGCVVVYNGDVVKSDTAIPFDLKAALQAAVRPLEDVPKIHKDYHPGSDGQVLDLVHPSLLPLIYGRSRVLEDRLIGLGDCIDNIGKGKVIEIRSDDETKLGIRPRSSGNVSEQNPYSKQFQWLPCDVDISGAEARVVSYINNLHPYKHKDLYRVIGQIISKAIPLWNLTLTALNEEDHTPRIKYELSFDPDPENIPDDQKPQQREDEDDSAYLDRIWEWENEVRKAVPSEAGDFVPPGEAAEKDTVNIVRDYSKRGLQVIVKLANIELTPEQPEYPGGSWHVEGQLNEHICATALYYYDNENITDSYLAFRQQSDTETAEAMYYPHGLHGWLNEIFGVETDGPAIQEVGAVFCKENRLLTFPNILQNQVQPFKLVDSSKLGYRKILALFLVDPNIRIIGTANVPPQQRDWWRERVDRDFSKTEVALGSLSNELKDRVYESVHDFPIGLDEAKEIRLRLMEERENYAIAHDENFKTTREFSL